MESLEEGCSPKEIAVRRYISIGTVRKHIEHIREKLGIHSVNEIHKEMIMKKLANIHPGEILDKEFLIPLNISAYRLSKEIKLPQTRISEIIKGKRRITADTALRLSKYFGNSPQFWLGLQNDYDLEEETNILKTELNKIHHYTGLMNNSKNHAANSIP